MEYIFTYLNETIRDQEEFLQMHGDNSEHHSEEFNNFFVNLIYKDVCNAVYSAGTAEFDECEGFMGGILGQGLYSANVAYWDNMRAMATDFSNSKRDNKIIESTINSDRFIQNEILKD